MTETYVTYRLRDGCRAPSNLERGSRLVGQLVGSACVDRDALLALADEIDEYADGGGARFGRVIDSRRAKGYAQRIREALGVSDG